MDEQQAIHLLQAGDIAGLEALVRVHQVRAVRAALLVTQDRALAEDIVQTAFLRVFERFDQFDAARPFAPWFLRIVVNDAVKVASRTRPILSLDDDSPDLPAPGLDPADLLERAETQAAVQTAIRTLSPAQRGVVVRRYYLGFSEAEIAAATDVPPGTVKWRLHAARARLRGLLAPLQAANSSQPTRQRAEPDPPAAKS